MNEKMMIELLDKLTETLRKVVETQKSQEEVNKQLVDEILTLKNRILMLEMEKQTVDHVKTLLSKEEVDDVDHK
tara:strand:+ start:2196 stop:2417 length:222 start_codon:yes stop_codon:yes gene_type:complete